MSIFNATLRTVFDTLLLPFRDLPALVGLAIASLATAAFLLVVFKRTSNQKALNAVKRQIHASFFEIRLFNDDFRTILRAQAKILRNNMRYLRYSSTPMLWMLPPLVLVIAQLQFHYGYDGIAVGQSALLKVFLDPVTHSQEKPRVSVESPAGLEVTSASVWIPSSGEMTWRIEARSPGIYEVRITEANDSVTKTIVVAKGVLRRSPFRIRGFWNELLYPAEPPLPKESSIRSIAVTYPGAEISVFGVGVHWMIVYCLLSIAFAFILKGPFRVVI